MTQRQILGQHWLINDTILEAIVKLAQLKPNQTVLEIGTGLGNLTDKLLLSQAKIISLEYDSNLHLKNTKKYKGVTNLKLIHCDIRRFDWQSLEAQDYKIVANIPYYLTANLLGSLVDLKHKPQLAVLLMPQAVVEKLISSNKRSLLAVLVQAQYQLKADLVVEAKEFDPPPKITSQVLVLETDKTFKSLNDEQWLKLVKLFKICFASPRKQLGNNLKARFKDLNLELILKNLSFDLSKRAESLTNKQWSELFKLLSNRL